MSIITKTGDDGTTGLMYGRRVPKHEARIEAYGSVDELTSALGVARAQAGSELGGHILAIQQDLIALMGELATAPEDLPRYRQDGYPVVTSAATVRLEALALSVEKQVGPLRGWSIPGGTPMAAALDLARAIGRRAERHICALVAAQQISNREILVYLNRLSDLLWLLARREEQQTTLKPGERRILT